MKIMLKAERRIILASVLLVLLTGVLVSVAATVPLYRSIRAQIEEVNLANARTQQISLEGQLHSYQDIATQFSSRTEIRTSLQAWLNHDISLDELRAFSLPRLLEPASHVEQLAALFRVSNGTLIAALGEQASHLDPPEPLPPNIPFAFHMLDTGGQPVLLIKISSPIRNPGGAVIGHDVLFFHAEEVLLYLLGFGQYGYQAEAFLYQPDQAMAVGLVPVNSGLQASLRPDALSQLSNHPELLQAGLHRLRDNNQDALLIVQPFDHGTTRLVITVPKQSFYVLAYQDLTGVHILIAALLLLAIIVSRQVIKPLISSFTRQAGQLEDSRAKLQLAASVFENTHEAIAITDPGLHLVQANQAMQTLCSYTQEELIGKPLNRCLNIPGHEQEPFFLLQQLCEQGRWQGEVMHVRTHGGTPRTSLLNISAVHDMHGAPKYYIHIFSDITARTVAEHKVRHLAAHDTLTGLVNRNSILARISATVAQHTPFSILFIDLDQFKPVNDLHGHQAGDEVLQLVAKRLQSVAREHDIIARLGGDEFLMLLETPHGTDFVERVATDAIDQLTQPFDIGGALVEIGASVGIAHYPEHGDTADSIIHAADLAMYCAKRDGGNRYSTADGNNDS